MELTLVITEIKINFYSWQKFNWAKFPQQNSRRRKFPLRNYLEPVLIYSIIHLFCVFESKIGQAILKHRIRERNRINWLLRGDQGLAQQMCLFNVFYLLQ